MDKQTLKTKLKQQAKQIAWRAITTVILTLTAVVTVWVYASFVEPAVGPNSSDQDFAQNILGNNDANNDFTSTSVVANNDGSMIERLEYLSQGNGLTYKGQCDSGMSASATSIVSAQLAGYGDDYFNNKFWLGVVRNANSVGNASEMEYRQITDYTSVSGTFVTEAFSANVEANDSIIVLHESLPFTKYKEYLTGSGNWTVPTNVFAVDVLIVAGGGSGGSSNNNTGGSGGGGGGEILKATNIPVKPGMLIPYVVGAGGVAASPGDNNGNNGANSSCGSLTVYGGLAGQKQSVHTGGNGGQTGVNGGAGTSDMSNGANGTLTTSGTFWRSGGGGGGGGGTQANWAAGAGGKSVLSQGGLGPQGGGGGGSLGTGGDGKSNATGESAGSNSGGGGGGTSSAGYAGGAGGSGYVRISWR